MQRRDMLKTDFALGGAGRIGPETKPRRTSLRLWPSMSSITTSRPDGSGSTNSTRYTTMSLSFPLTIWAVLALLAAVPYSRSVESYQVPPVMLTDSNGRQVSLPSLINRDGPVMLQFIFTTCTTICPVMSATLAASQSQLEGAHMISISIDPEHDTPARLQEYARSLKAPPQWQFLTGRAVDIVAVQEAFRANRGNKMRHLPLTFLRASLDQRWVRLDGLTSAAQLIAEYHRLVHR
jgi:protein SCO1/2